MGKKRPVQKALPPDLRKQPRGADKARGADSERITWQFQALDPDGPWGWRGIDPAVIWDRIFHRARHLESMTWAQIMDTGSHPIPVESIAPEAQRRLEAIGQADVDEIFSLRFTGKERLWGIRDRHILKVLWWDPEHKVCPSYKKHT